MFFRRKIPCYVLVYDQLELIKKSLGFLTGYAKRLDIIVIENPSGNTAEIKRYIDGLGRRGLIKRYYLMDDNVTGNAYGAVLEHEIATVQKSPFVLVTDGDLTCDDSGWLDEETNILKRHRDIFACGVSWDMSNLPLKAFPEAGDWIPADKSVHHDYNETVTGIQLLMFRGRQLADFINWKNEHRLNFVDGVLHKYCYEVLGKKWARTKKAHARHLTWDLYADRKHAYTKKKTGKDFRATWYHDQAAGFKLTTY